MGIWYVNFELLNMKTVHVLSTKTVKYCKLQNSVLNSKKFEIVWNYNAVWTQSILIMLTQKLSK